MTILFIADLHLKSKNHLKKLGFFRFLQCIASKADSLYILGDLFEIWIGDDEENNFHYETAEAIKKLVDSGVPCYFIHGNRDFLLGNYFANKSGIILLPKEKVLNLYGKKVLIMHGDALCTNDILYQLFSSKVQNNLSKKLFLALPLFIRSKIATKIRICSKLSNDNKSLIISDVNQKTVVHLMKKYKVQWLIHGHTHIPNVHEFIINNKPAFRIVVGPWLNEGSIVKVTPKTIEVIKYFF